jgi:putative Mg2+ transporter-C (MgtC) family protein
VRVDHTTRERSLSDGVLVARIALALVLASAIGLEREFRRKPAGLRTNAVVGVGAAVAMIVSKYGFSDMHGANVSLDPSRVAAQIVSGIGFLGAGIIIVRRGSVSGLTTAAVVWGTAMIGMAVGAGMIAIAIAATVAHFVISLGFPVVVKRMPRSPWSATPVCVTYLDHRGVLREVLAELTQRGASVSHLEVDRDNGRADRVAVTLQVTGRAPTSELASAVAQLDGVLSVRAGESEDS